MFTYKGVLCVLLAGAIAVPAALPKDDGGDDGGSPIKHVLLLSIDGMHAVDYLNCANGLSGPGGPNGGASYCPNLASLGATGVNYSNAITSKPSDSFPGLTAIVSGGTPRSFGVYYDVAYDRVLAPPASDTGNGLKGGNCIAGQPNGTSTEYEEGIDINQSLLNGGAPGAGPTDGGIASIDSTKLIRDPYNNCRPVYPWNFPRTNTIFGVIHKNGGYTAWSDKHPAYSSVSGPGDGSNVDDFYGPEINSDTTLAANQAAVKNIVPPVGGSCATVDASGDWTTSFHDIRCYDTLKVNAILNEISGNNHLGTAKTKRPTLLGMNFQAVSVGQKLIANGVKGGYLDAQGTPSAELLTEIEFVDASIGEMVSALKANGIFKSTLIVITAKHGQSPIDPILFYPVPGNNKDHGTTPADLLGSTYLPDSELNQIGPTQDDVSLLWLKSTSQTQAAADALETASRVPGDSSYIGLGQIYYGQSLRSMLNTPGLPPNGDPRTPDIVVTPNIGIIYTKSTAKQEEHGGFAHDDTNVMLLLSNPTFSAKMVTSDVQTAQVAPTILKALDLSPNALQAVQLEGTPVLPAVKFANRHE